MDSSYINFKDILNEITAQQRINEYFKKYFYICLICIFMLSFCIYPLLKTCLCLIIENSINDLEAKASQFETDISALKEKDVELKNDISSLKEKDTELENSINNLETKSTELENYVKANFYTKTEITNLLKEYYTKNEIDTKLLTKQEKLTAGDNITISDDNVISALGGGGGTIIYEVISDATSSLVGVGLVGSMIIE